MNVVNLEEQSIGTKFLEAQKIIDELSGIFQSFTPNYTSYLLTQPPYRQDARLQELHNLEKQLSNYTRTAEDLLTSVKGLKEQIALHHAGCASARAPISVLPVEIVREILCLTIFSDQEPSFALHGFLGVCRQWRDIILFEKNAWASLKFNSQNRQTGKIIEQFHVRSHPLPFDMEFKEIPDTTFPLHAVLETPFLQNLRSLMWQSQRSFGQFLKALKHHEPDREDASHYCFPKLSILHIGAWRFCPTCGQNKPYGLVLHKDISKLGSYFPSLTNLSLERVGCALEEDIISRLEKLRLHSVPFDAATYNTIFKSGSKLRKLEIIGALDYLGHPQEDNLDSSNSAEWVLPQLEELALFELSSSVASFVMRHVPTPALEKLVLGALLTVPPGSEAAAMVELNQALGIQVTNSLKLRVLHLIVDPVALPLCCAVVASEGRQIEVLRAFPQFPVRPGPIPRPSALLSELVELVRGRLEGSQKQPAECAPLQRLEVEGCMVRDLADMDDIMSQVTVPIPGTMHSIYCRRPVASPERQ
ncbi:hypothetical protein DL93DRAFT_2076205 [Clavulina sp. PMI_390]|nr:hypothetical protein DL93DRAFT_2076205 [Clavulina sp. PMI_390]